MTFVKSVAAIGILGCSILPLTNAIAGDASKLNILGFSADGSVFAFEEYGVQDGSGFPYANRFYIDTQTDQFTGGSPFRVRLDDEAQLVETARTQAMAAGEAFIVDADLKPAFTAGFNQITEISADPYRMAVNPRLVVPPIDAPIEFRLDEKSFAPNANCEAVQTESVGFSLTMLGLEPGQVAKNLHDDTGVPASRGCPDGYRIGGVHTYYPEGGQPVYAVTIAVRSFGFEGPDHRWMAVTTQSMASNNP